MGGRASWASGRVSVGVEVLNVGGWLTHEDFALAADVDFFWLLLCVVWFLQEFVMSGAG